MIQRVIDNKLYRVAISIIVGVPMTLIGLLGFCYGVIFIFIFLTELVWLYFILGLLGILGSVAVIAAWVRLLKCYRSMGQLMAYYVRLGIILGVVINIIVCTLFTLTQVWWLALLFFILLGFASLLLSLTPNKVISETC